MIPLHLSLSGFLSYRDPVEIDFAAFDLACIAGPNGAGKSSLLDAITWALFGQARKRDDSLINTLSSSAEVTLTFAYEKNIYRVTRAKPREKTMLLEFNIWQDPSLLHGHPGNPEERQGNGNWEKGKGSWKPLTEHTLRETESRIQQILRLDYETFVNASFFLQGKADQFTQQRPGDRKRILSSILGLEVWEQYRARAAERRREVEGEIDVLDGRLKEIASELAEEEARKARLKVLESDLERMSVERVNQEALVTNVRQITATLAEQGRLVENLKHQLEESTRNREVLQERLEGRCQERDTYNELLERAADIEAAYAAWQDSRNELERLEQISSSFHEQEKRRQEPRLEIQAARARLEQELETLQSQEAKVKALVPDIELLQEQRRSVETELAQAQANLDQRGKLEVELQAAQQRGADARAQNSRLKSEMDELKSRIDQLEESEGAECPLCGGPLSPDERQNLLQRLQNQGKEMGDSYRANQTLVSELEAETRRLEAQIGEFSQAEAMVIDINQALAQVDSRLEAMEHEREAWVAEGAPRLLQIIESLEGETYAPEARLRLAEIDGELKAIGYDAAAHDAVRQAELQGRSSEDALRALDRARAALAPIEREIVDLQGQIQVEESRSKRLAEDHRQAAEALALAQESAPDLAAAEQALLGLQEQENQLRMEVGAAHQRVLVLEDQKARKAEYESQRQDFASQVGQYRQLERAFGKDGVPALLIEQALPQIEERANELLHRLSDGYMSVRFVTQAEYKDKRREDLRETLDIQISDHAGVRDYEMYSGGEAFRVNFAIRLALAEILAQRAGARLQTLVIDEGFGSQDAQGRQRLIEAINLVRPDFAKILVITHIDELKDAFPNRIEVEKTERGSLVQVV